MAKLEIELQPSEEAQLSLAARSEGLTLTEYARRHLLRDAAGADYDYKTATPEERARAFQSWADSHEYITAPLISDEALRRENMYEDRGL